MVEACQNELERSKIPMLDIESDKIFCGMLKDGKRTEFQVLFLFV
jgi:hypothetical protein